MHEPIESTPVFQEFESAARRIWLLVDKWPPFEKNSLGRQLVRAADSVGANLVEGDGRFSGPDSIRFFIMARASAREALLWVRRAIERGLIPPSEGDACAAQLENGLRQLNGLIDYRRKHESSSVVRELQTQYRIFDLPDDDEE
jgi:four helix bundle protein